MSIDISSYRKASPEAAALAAKLLNSPRFIAEIAPGLPAMLGMTLGAGQAMPSDIAAAQAQRDGEMSIYASETRPFSAVLADEAVWRERAKKAEKRLWLWCCLALAVGILLGASLR